MRLPRRRWEVYAVAVTTGDALRPPLHLPNPRFWARCSADDMAGDLNHYAQLLQFDHRYAVRRTTVSPTAEPPQLPDDLERATLPGPRRPAE